MTYDFTTIMERHGKDAMAVDALGLQGFPGAPKEGFDAIPMWVADMNFPTVPTITEAIARRIAHPAFGYFCRAMRIMTRSFAGSKRAMVWRI